MDDQTINLIIRLIWLLGAVAFVLGLIRMNSPATARSGNQLSAAGSTALRLANMGKTGGRTDY